MFQFTTCQMCGKDFIRQPGSIYRLNFAGQAYQFCSYSCYTAAKRCKEQIQATTHEITYARIRSELNSKKESVNV